MALLIAILSLVLLLWGLLHVRPGSSRAPTDGSLSTPDQSTDARDAEPTVISAMPAEAEANRLPDGEGGIVYCARQMGRRRLFLNRLNDWEGALIFEGDWDDCDAALSPDGAQLLFASNRDGPWDLYLLAAGAAGVRRLTNTPEFEGHGSWSPDGRWIAFEGDYEGNLDIWILPIDGDGRAIQFTEHPGVDITPAWHPNGRRIAFVSNREGQRDIFVGDLDHMGDGFINITQTPEGEEADPAFSPDGDYLAYTVLQDGIEQITLLDLGSETGEIEVLGQGANPAWSPGGNEIIALLQGEQQRYLRAFGIDGVAQPSIPAIPPGRHLDLAWFDRDWLWAMDLVRAQVEDVQGEEDMPPHLASPQQGRLPVVELPDVDASHPFLVAGAASAFGELRSRTASLTGWDFLASLEKAFVGLNEPLPPGVSHEDWSRTGRAFSFDLGALNAEWVEIVREQFGGRTYWRVFVRVRPQDGRRGEPLRMIPWDFQARYLGDPFAYDEGGRPKDDIPSGYYIDFTALAADYGFERLPALANWRTYYHGARFNQFVYREGLSWEAAMLDIYPAEAVATPTAFRTPTATATITLTPTWTPTRTRTPWVWPTTTAAPTTAPIATAEAP